MRFWRKIGRGLKVAGKGAASVAPLAIPLAASVVSPQLGQIASELLKAAEVSVPGRGRGYERLKRLRESLADVAPAVGVEIAAVSGKPVRNQAELRKALEHHALFIHHLEKAYAECTERPA